mgnify:FL=1
MRLLLRELAGSVKKVLNSRSNLIGGAPLNSHMKTKADLRESSSIPSASISTSQLSSEMVYENDGPVAPL